ncbi:MAG TPA: ABC transporter ATP-binding protein [Thermoleophilaceae bacterium]|nr:ABC transporter ATP-binding protein [Thermoleophilaceae bacterium]
MYGRISLPERDGVGLELAAAVWLGDFELGIELAVPGGSCLALAGPSGAGKSTVLRIVAGLLRPHRGSVRCGDVTWLDVEAGVDVAPELRQCGYVFQDYALFPHMKAWQNVAYGLRAEVRGRAERRRRAEALLERFGVADLAEARPRTLSGGERQRVALARALAPRPRALLLDEPLTALDARTRGAATRELASLLREADVPTLLVTHDFAEAATLGDTVGVMAEGRLVQQGKATDLAARPVSAFVADFTGAVVLSGFARPGADGLTLVDLDGGGAIASVDEGTGPVAASVFPWELALEPPDGAGRGSARNRLAVEVTSVTALGSRMRVGLDGPQRLTAEVSEASVRELGLAPGRTVVATWKAAATRLTSS